ncbi:MAG: hypothetical protein ABR507_12410, partial [Actinomycetota bacterium]
MIQGSSRIRRAVLYGIGGLLGEISFTALCEGVKTGDRRLLGRTSLWMFPVYACLQPAFEPFASFLRRHLPLYMRGPIYAGAFLAAERSAASGISALGGKVPWDYSHSRWSRCCGTVRLD